MRSERQTVLSPLWRKLPDITGLKDLRKGMQPTGSGAIFFIPTLAPACPAAAQT